MIFDLTSDSGLISVGPFSFHWYSKDDQFPGFTSLNAGNYGLEFGDIDSGNGIFFVKYGDGDIDYIKTLVQLP